MRHGAEKTIYRLSAVCVVLTALAFVIPRFVPTQEGGLAGAAAAVLVLLGVLLGAAIVSLYLLVVTLRAYREIPLLPRLVGIGPSVVLGTALVLLLVALQY